LPNISIYFKALNNPLKAKKKRQLILHDLIH